MSPPTLRRFLSKKLTLTQVNLVLRKYWFLTEATSMIRFSHIKEYNCKRFHQENKNSQNKKTTKFHQPLPYVCQFSKESVSSTKNSKILVSRGRIVLKIAEDYRPKKTESVKRETVRSIERYRWLSSNVLESPSR